MGKKTFITFGLKWSGMLRKVLSAPFSKKPQKTQKTQNYQLFPFWVWVFWGWTPPTVLYYSRPLPFSRCHGPVKSAVFGPILWNQPEASLVKSCIIGHHCTTVLLTVKEWLFIGKCNFKLTNQKPLFEALTISWLSILRKLN